MQIDIVQDSPVKVIRVKVNELQFHAVVVDTFVRLSLSFLYLEKTTEHDFSIDIFIFHLISHCSSSLSIN
ncbi:hypothetical protein BpHYR1_035368 [Brachionus plicatilis]|uniref:Uncharacterized protein n=1 Tax=Brachionus plicatilis TaxID=10195 RepID=A0A3M7S8H7_BRAPC|nr:hypothetical protein BpHYR1_035368 [Brachionus plicatilis]